MTGHLPKLLKDWVLEPSVAFQPVGLDGSDAESKPIGEGCTLPLGKLWTDPVTQKRVAWMEQVFFFRSYALAQRELLAFHRRLQKAEQALEPFVRRPGKDPVKLQAKIQQLLDRHRVEDLLEVKIQKESWTEERLIGPGRPGPHRPRQVVEHLRLVVHFRRCTQAIEDAEALMGWRVYASNTSPKELSLADAIGHYRAQWQPERGFHRFKGGRICALPLYLQDDARIRGLMLLLGIALRVLTLMEFVVRRNLEREHQELAGLYDGNPRRSTSRPSAEKLLSAFKEITLYRHHRQTHLEEEITPLSPLQIHILELMDIPQTIYAGPEPGPSG
jgi:transposase